MTDYEVQHAKEMREERTGVKDPDPGVAPLWVFGVLLSALYVVIGVVI